MNYEDFMKVIRGRRSIRLHKSDPINDEIISQVIEAGKWAPTGNNTQPFEIVVVKERPIIERMEDIMGEGYDPKMTRHYGAPVMLIILGDPRFCDAYPKNGLIREEILHSSLSAVIENMLLASTAVGLGGSLWKTASPYAAMKIKDLLGIPQLFILKALIPLGYPKEVVVSPPKRDIVVHENRYDLAKLKSEEEIRESINEYSVVKHLDKIRAL